MLPFSVHLPQIASQFPHPSPRVLLVTLAPLIFLLLASRHANVLLGQTSQRGCQLAMPTEKYLDLTRIVLRTSQFGDSDKDGPQFIDLLSWRDAEGIVSTA